MNSIPRLFFREILIKSIVVLQQSTEKSNQIKPNQFLNIRLTISFVVVISGRFIELLVLVPFGVSKFSINGLFLNVQLLHIPGLSINPGI